MSKAHRVRAGGGDLQAEASELTQKPIEEQLSNEYLTALLELAGEQAGVQETSLLSLAGDVELDLGGKYWFAEDGDDLEGGEQQARRAQDLDLPELRDTHKDAYGYHDYETGVAFVRGASDSHDIDPNDVAQGALGDCYLMAGMLAVARANPERIRDLIVDNGDGTFDVTLYIRDSYYSEPKRVVTTIDAQLPSKRAGVPLYASTGDQADGQTELWPALLEKAVAQQKGSYELISGGNIARGFQFHGATELFTGKAEGYLSTDSLDEDDVLLHIAIALDDGKPVTVDSRNLGDDEALTREATSANVYWNHAYAPLAVDLEARTLDLTNPWGSHHVTALSVKDFMRYYRAIRIGE